MRKITLLVACLFGFTAMNAQVVLTQNTDNVITADNSVGCPGGDNFWARNFILADEGITDAFTINSGEIGVQSSSTSADEDITVNIYISDAGFPTSAFTLIGSQVVTVPAGTPALSIISYSFDTPVTVPAGIEAVVVEISSPLEFFIGGTIADEAEAFLKSVTCQLPDYGSVSSIGFPDAHFYITVSDEILAVENQSMAQISLYPNPVQGQLNITLPSSVELQSATMYDLLGKATTMKIGENNTLNTANLASGMYILKLETNQGVMTKKVVKK